VQECDEWIQYIRRPPYFGRIARAECILQLDYWEQFPFLLWFSLAYNPQMTASALEATVETSSGQPAPRRRRRRVRQPREGARVARRRERRTGRIPIICSPITKASGG
jgi:hypothetical protein